MINQDNSPPLRLELRLSSGHLKGTSKIKRTFSQTKKSDNKMDILIDRIKTLNDNLQRSCSELICSANLLQNLAQEMNIQLKSNQDVWNKNLATIQQKMEDLHYATFDGSFIWKFTNFAKKRNEAQFGQQTWFNSPVFYSSPTGYKMRARLYPYGDGDARSTHMTINLVIFKGEYDAILQWPFNFTVIFCLFDQTGENHHIVDSFYPDTISTSFQRPSSEMNIPSGIQKFCSLMIFEQGGNRYIQDDTMFIKIMIDFGRTPRELLPYTSSLNPGLPTYIQEATRRILIEQHNQVRAALTAELDRNDQEVSQSILAPMRQATIRQQLYTSATSSDGIPPEDILHAD